mgnify:FL=1
MAFKSPQRCLKKTAGTFVPSYSHTFAMIYKIDYCIKGQPKRKSHLYTWAGDDEDAAFYALDWVVAHDYSLLNVSRT